MKPPRLQCLTLLLLAVVVAGTSEKVLAPLMELMELDFEDRCPVLANGLWDELTGKPGALQNKLEADKSYGLFVNHKVSEVRNWSVENVTPLLKRKIYLLTYPGDATLQTEQWNRLVTFADTVYHNLEFSTDYDCGNGQKECTLSELNKNLVEQKDEKVLQRMKQSWEKKLPDESTYMQKILPLLNNASLLNGQQSVEDYWNDLTEYEGALLKAREIWEELRPMYVKLNKYVALRLREAGANVSSDNVIPAYTLKSLKGDDWSRLMNLVIPKNGQIYHHIEKNLRKKDIGGRQAFIKASKLIKALDMGPVDTRFFDESIFDKNCPTKLVDAVTSDNTCQAGRMKAITCNDVSLNNYLEAHEVLMKVKYKEAAATYSRNTYILREANRYSALYEGLPGLASLLALSPHALDKAGLFPLKRFNNNPDQHKIVLQLYTALKDFPALNYYLAVDEWRLNKLMSQAQEVGDSWKELRRTFSFVETSPNDVLGDEYVLFNKPYVGKFMGLILKYQIYQSFASDLYYDDSVIDYVAQNKHRLMEAMLKAYSVKWPEIVTDILAKREYGVESSGISEYYKLLDEFLENNLESHDENGGYYTQNDNTEYPDEDDEEETEEVVSAENESKGIESEDIQNNIDSNINENQVRNSDTETTTVMVLENRKALDSHEIDHNDLEDPDIDGLPNTDSKTNPEKKGYTTYVWVALGVGAAIVLVLVLIVARKRQNHRKELERQRKQASVA